MLLLLLLALLLLIVIGVPIVLCMGVVGLAGMLLLPGVNPALFPQRMFAMLDNYALLALPFFILAGSVMAHGGLSVQLVRFAQTLVGHLRAGLCHAAVVSSMVFANVSGSSVADASAIGSVVIPTMKRAGYRPGFAAALMACTGTIAAIIPPSMVMVVYGSMAQVSIGGLFLGGIIPGFLLGIFPMITIKLHTYAPSLPELRATSGRFELRQVWRALLEVWPALLAPLVIIGGILSGVFTATEVVMANQIGSTTPPVAVLLFVTTSIAETTFDQTVRYVFPFILAEVLVLALVVLYEPVASAIPHWVFG